MISSFLMILPWVFTLIVYDPNEGYRVIEATEYSTFETCSYNAKKKVDELLGYGYQANASCEMNALTLEHPH